MVQRFLPEKDYPMCLTFTLWSLYGKGCVLLAFQSRELSFSKTISGHYWEEVVPENRFFPVKKTIPFRKPQNSPFKSYPPQVRQPLFNKKNSFMNGLLTPWLFLWRWFCMESRLHHVCNFFKGPTFGKFLRNNWPNKAAPTTSSCYRK